MSKLPVIVAWAALAAVSVSAPAQAQRQTVPLGKEWKFIKQDAAPDAAFDAWETVSVPHTWNAVDGQNGKAADPGLPEGYYRGPGWYARKLDIPASWQNKRVFVRFGAASLVADTYINGRRLGQHRGGFAAFCYELTPDLKFGGENLLRVRVDNATTPDVAPLSADFTKEGGLYRPVELIVTDKTCVSPLDFAGPGVYLRQKNVSTTEASVEVETLLNSSLPGDASVRVETEIRDASGKAVQTVRSDETVPGGKVDSVKQSVTLAHPHLWNGRTDPYLYSVRVRVVRNGKTVDEVIQPLGIRTFRIDEPRGFLLNEQPYALHGVNRHQERRDKGWALNNADQDEDQKLILEVGATCLRLAHYQQSDYFLDLCDKSGLLLWQEIPVVNQINDSPAFAENARQQLTEEIKQGFNHPSLMVWSLSNELAENKSFPAEPLIQSLNTLAHALDPSRLTGSASNHPQQTALNHSADIIGFNLYPGWYGGKAEDFGNSVQQRYEKNYDSKRVAITEYGAGGNPSQHQEGALLQPKPGGPFHPEEWQAYVHEQAWAAAKDNPRLWATYLWAMFDFASDGRNEGSTPGVNDKGLVTEDRKIKKDTFFFYKANWNPDPMVYIASRRMTPRKLPTTEVKVYSNCSDVELFVNGKSLGTANPDTVQVFRWQNVTLKPGKNQIEVRGKSGNALLTDHCEWVLESGA